MSMARGAVLPLLVIAALCGYARSMELPVHARHGRLWEMLQTESETALYMQDASAHWFPQRLDHFATASTTFPQRYYQVDTHWTSPDGPVILYIGGEGTLENAPTGYVRILAKAWGAKILALEHRFYGASVPGNDLSTSNYRYLTVQQALADLAYFREQIQEMLPNDENKWIAIGGSYPGALSAWFRVAYPNVTVASLASSGVVLPVYMFAGFDEQVALSAGKKCAAVLRKTTAAFEASIRGGNSTQVKRLFGAEALEDADFFYMLADAAAMAVQYGHKDVVCGHMTAADQHDQSLIEAFARFTIKMYGADFGHECFYDTACLSDDGDRKRWPNARSWRWQKCSQLAYFQIAPTNGSLRASMVDIAYHERQCRTIFGDTVNPSQGVQEIIKLYGGVHPKTHRVYFSNGGDDPWQRASIVESLSSDLIANLAKCDLCGHCGDLGGSEHIPLPLHEQRREIMKVMTGWLEDVDDAASQRIDILQVQSSEASLATANKSSRYLVAGAVLAVLAIVAAVMRRAKRHLRSRSYRNDGYIRLESEQ